MQNPFLVGERIHLRPLERADAACFLPWINDAEITRTLLLYRPMNLQSEEAFIDKIAQDEHAVALGIVLKDGDRLIGATGLHNIDNRHRHASFGLMIGEKNEWGKGHGREATRLLVGYAFETLNLNRVWLHVLADHERAIRAYESVGFRREGLLRQHHFREGRYWDYVSMAVLREEWGRQGK